MIIDSENKVIIILTLSLGLVDSLASRSRVHSNLSLHDETILEQLLDVLSYKYINITLIFYSSFDYVRFVMVHFIIFK
jgi:hypothetical protein